MKVVIVRSQLEIVSPRVNRNTKALVSHGHNVVILAWDRMLAWDNGYKYPKMEYKDNYKIRRFKFKAPSGPKILFFLPIWWCFVFLWLMKTRWDIVHAIEFDTIFPAIIAAKIKRKKVIYELNDIYENMIPLPKIIRKIGLYIDKIFTYFANAVIIAEETTIKELNGIPNENIILIYNSPPDYFKEPGNFIQRENKEKNKFTIFYAGALFKHRQLNLDKLIESIKGIDDTKIIIAGYGDLVNDIKKWVIEAKGKVQFIGKINYNEVIERTIKSDLLVFLHDPNVPINKVSSSNKVFEAMMLSKPIMAIRGSYTAEIIEKEGCGLVLDYLSVDEIKKAIIRLKENPDLCCELGENGRRAYEQKFGWEIMEHRLLTLYEKIGRNKSIDRSGKNCCSTQ